MVKYSEKVADASCKHKKMPYNMIEPVFLTYIEKYS